MDKKSVFFLVGSLKGGGAEKVCSRVGENLIKAGYNIKFVLLKNEIDLPVAHLNRSIIHLNTQNFKYRGVKMLMAYFLLWKLYFQFKPIKIVSFSSGLNVLLFFSFLPNQIFRIDTNLFWVNSKLYRRRLLKIIGFFPNVKKIITPSEELRLRFGIYLKPSIFKKFVTIHNPIVQPVISEKHIDDNTPYLISVGRLNKYKGFEQLIRCFAQIKTNKDLKLYILGSGPMKDTLENLIEKLDATESVKLLGFKKNPQSYIANSEALILNSTFEAFPNVLIEALMLGTPVISNDCDFGPREIIFDGIKYSNFF